MKQIGNSVVKLVLLNWKKLEPLQNDDLKTMTKVDLEALMASILARGITSAFQAWDHKGKIKLLDGHQRIRAFKVLEKKGHKIDLVPVLMVAAKNEREAREILLSNVAQYAKVSDEGLYQFMHDTGMKFEQLSAEFVIPGVDLESFGASYFKDVAFTAKDTPDAEDEVPELKTDKPKAKIGQVFKLGEHRLMCGDSTDQTHVERLIGNDKVDLVFTDPPYGMFLNADYRTGNGPGIYKGPDAIRASGGRKHRNVIGDKEDWSPKLIESVFLAFRNVKEIFLWGADYYAEFLPDRNSGSWIVWDKVTKADGEVSGVSTFHGSNFELCWSRQRHKRDLARIMHKGLASVENDKRQHPTQKPVALAEWFFERFGQEARVVADLFGGSGSTLIACEKTKRRCLMMEIDPAYVDVIVARWEKFTGQKAELLSSQKKSKAAASARPPGGSAKATPPARPASRSQTPAKKSAPPASPVADK